MAERWGRYRLTAELLSDAHPGSGSGGSGIDALVARDRHDRPVIWASHIEGVLRDAARRLRGDRAAGDFFGRAGGDRQRAVFTSLYSATDPGTHIWRSTAREACDNRAPKNDTLRVIEYVPRGTKLVGHVEVLDDDLPTLRRLLQEVDALGGGRSAGAGRVSLTLAEEQPVVLTIGDATERLLLLLKNVEPLCITATATPDNLIPSLAFVPGRTLLGAIAAWLIAEGDRDTASLFVRGRVSVSDALPVSDPLRELESAGVLPAPLSLRSEKPKGSVGEVPWWAQLKTAVRRLDAWNTEEKLKRPEDDLFVYREGPEEPWETFRPARRVRLRNGRPDSGRAEPLLFAIEQIVEETHFLAELRGPQEDMARLAEGLAPVLEGRRWLRMGRGGAPVEVVQLTWAGEVSSTQQPLASARLTLTSDLLVRDKLLRWYTALDESAVRALPGWPEDVQITRSVQDSVPVHGFNGTSRLWRMPAMAIRRGSVFEVSGAGIAELMRIAAQGKWLGERTHEGFGRFRIDETLPGVTDGVTTTLLASIPDAEEDAVAITTRAWLNGHRALAKAGRGIGRKPSLSQWFDLVADLERRADDALSSRLQPSTAGGRSWTHPDAKAVLVKLQAVQADDARAEHARLFVRWLRAEVRVEQRKEATA